MKIIHCMFKPVMIFELSILLVVLLATNNHILNVHETMRNQVM